MKYYLFIIIRYKNHSFIFNSTKNCAFCSPLIGQSNLYPEVVATSYSLYSRMYIFYILYFVAH